MPDDESRVAVDEEGMAQSSYRVAFAFAPRSATGGAARGPRRQRDVVNGPRIRLGLLDRLHAAGVDPKRVAEIFAIIFHAASLLLF